MVKNHTVSVDQFRPFVLYCSLESHQLLIVDIRIDGFTRCAGCSSHRSLSKVLRFPTPFTCKIAEITLDETKKPLIFGEAWTTPLYCFHQTDPLIKYPIPSQEADEALVTLLGLQVLGQSKIGIVVSHCDAAPSPMVMLISIGKGVRRYCRTGIVIEIGIQRKDAIAFSHTRIRDDTNSVSEAVEHDNIAVQCVAYIQHFQSVCAVHDRSVHSKSTGMCAMPYDKYSTELCKSPRASAVHCAILLTKLLQTSQRYLDVVFNFERRYPQQHAMGAKKLAECNFKQFVKLGELRTYKSGRKPMELKPPRKPALRIFFTVAWEYGFLRCVSKIMDSVSMFRLVYCSTSFRGNGRSTTATDAPIPLQFIDGSSICTYALHALHLRGCGHAFRIFHVWTPHALGTPIHGRTV
ncbi:hypothetical protein EVAR_32695_1 [Eumeta japonica]|uniref:Uncharacterized protein n=1 Tax=Eumeta variegata TaxID=151549 RepID=A0A4C1VQI6_EUMVA|nr:hypothetical protein EVAR_32695_1 [Eumeta japonica]